MQNLDEIVEGLVDRLYQNISGEEGVRIDLISSHNRPIECIRKTEMKKIIRKEIETTPIKRLRKIMLTYENRAEVDAWWLGYCDGGCWPPEVYQKGREIIFNHFRK